MSQTKPDLKIFNVRPKGGRWLGHTKEYILAAEDPIAAARECYDHLRPAEGKNWRNGGPPVEFRVYTMASGLQLREEGVFAFETDESDDPSENIESFSTLWHGGVTVRL